MASALRSTWLACALLAACGGEDDGDVPSGPPNVLWISLDTLRADRLGCYGNARDTSPAIDRLAAEGVLFERAISTTSWTLPAHISMLTGLPISSHGMCFHNYGRDPHPMRGTYVSETLADAGYATAGFYAHKYLDGAYYTGSRFDVWERTGRVHHRSLELREEWQQAMDAGRKREAKRLVDEHHDMYQKGAPEADEGVDRALGWLEGHLASAPEQPFLLFLHVFDIHTPYVPPPPYDERFDPDYAGSVHEPNVDSPTSRIGAGMNERDLEHIVALYDGEIAWVDSQVDRLLARVDELGLVEDTLVILTSDHGEEFLDHGLTGHQKELYRESIHVPLILRLPGRLPAGARIAAPATILDLVPTVLALADVPPAQVLPGVDLAAIARGDATMPERTLLSELVKIVQETRTYWRLSLFSADEHVIVRDLGLPAESAVRFDLRSNPTCSGPGEAVDPDSPEGRALRAQIEAARTQLADLRANAARRDETSVELNALDRAELEALGYTEFDAELTGDGEKLCMDGCVWREE